MAINPDPNKQANESLFYCNTKPVNHPPILINGFPVVQVKETKHLGLRRSVRGGLTLSCEIERVEQVQYPATLLSLVYGKVLIGSRCMKN